MRRDKDDGAPIRVNHPLDTTPIAIRLGYGILYTLHYIESEQISLMQTYLNLVELI